MKRLAQLSALMAIVISISSCLVKSIHPICYPGDSIMVPQIIGTWQDEKGEMTVIIGKAGKNIYRVVYLDKDNPAVFSGCAANIGGKLFVDLMPISGVGNNNLQNLSLFSAHMVFRVEPGKDRLVFAYLDHEWMKQSLKSGAVKIQHETRISGQGGETDPYVEIILTASTEELAAFLASIAGNDKAFGKPVELKRNSQ